MTQHNTDDEKWFNALSGHTPESEASSEAEQEGLRLRKAILAQHKRSNTVHPIDEQHAMQAMLFKLKSKGLIDKKTTDQKRFWSIPFPAAIAAGVAVAIILPFAYFSTQQSTSIDDTTQGLAHTAKVFDALPKASQNKNLSVIYSDKPSDTALTLSRELHALDIDNQAFQLNNAWHVEAKINSNQATDNITQLAQKYDFSIGTDGQINLRIEKKK